MPREIELKELILKIMQKVDRIDNRLSLSLSKPPKQTWVKVKVLRTLTGWDKHEMMAARRNHVITWKKDAKGYWYLVESIPDQLIKKTNAI